MTDALLGNVALITGASRGIGAASAVELASHGAAVILAARSLSACESIAASITANGGRALAVPCDVTSPEALRATVTAAQSTFGPVDILINNAGMVDPIARISELTTTDFDQTVAVNLNGAFYAIHAVLPGMLANGGGTIVNVSSGAAIRPLEGWTSYSVGKAGLAMLTQAVHTEEGERIRVFGFQPGTVDTEMQGVIRASGINPVSQMTREQHLPPEVPASVIRFLCTAAANDLAGKEISVRDESLLRRAGLT